METRTRFNLTAAIRRWAEEVEAQPGLRPESRRELEAHLRDTVAGLRERGLNDEECFWLATRRIGHPREIAEEFAKEDPARIWRERMFWVVAGIFVMRLWWGLPVMLLDRLVNSGIVPIFARNLFLPDWVLFYLPFEPRWVVEHVLRDPFCRMFLQTVPLILILILFAQGRMERAVSTLRFAFRSRRRFLIAAAASIGIYYTWWLSEAWRSAGQVPGTPHLGFLIQVGVAGAVISAMFVGLITWLMPGEKSSVEPAR